jgi:hypothetical protein
MSLKQLVNNKDIWDAFNEELDKLIAQQHKSIETQTDAYCMYRIQGQIQAYKNLKYLRDKVNGER